MRALAFDTAVTCVGATVSWIPTAARLRPCGQVPCRFVTKRDETSSGRGSEKSERKRARVGLGGGAEQNKGRSAAGDGSSSVGDGSPSVLASSAHHLV